MSCFDESAPLSASSTTIDGHVKSEKESQRDEREQYLKDRGVVIEHPPSHNPNPNPNSNPIPYSISSEDEDRIEWLRSRGVQIELAEDRHKVSTVGAIPAADLMELTLVKIPCDDREHFSEVHISVLKKAQGDQITKTLAPLFAATTKETDLDEGLFFENAKKQLSSQAVSVTKDTLAKVGQMGGAEAFPLSRPCAGNNFKGVNLYVDEIGQLKSLARNRRAVDLAARCGYTDVALVGDIYVGRVYLVGQSSALGSILHNENFPLSDLSSDAAWIKSAHAENYERGIQTNQITMKDEKAAIQAEHAKEKEMAGGGTVAGMYKWSETEENVEINYTFDKKISAKELKVVIKTNSVTVSNKADASVVYFTVSDLDSGIRVDDSSWSVSAVGAVSKIDITLDKISPQFWGKLLK